MKSVVNWGKLHQFLDIHHDKPYNLCLNKTPTSMPISKTVLLPMQDREVILVKFPLYSTSHCLVGTFINIISIILIVPYSYTGKKKKKKELKCKSQDIKPSEVSNAAYPKRGRFLGHRVGIQQRIHVGISIFRRNQKINKARIKKENSVSGLLV